MQFVSLSIAKLCAALQRDEAAVGWLLAVARTSKRPVFHKELGQRLVALRNKRGWSVQEAVNYSQRTHPRVLTWNRLTRLESGKTKHPDAEALRAVADLYDLDYRRLATDFIAANYGSDLIRHDDAELSPLPAISKGEVADDATAARIRQLEGDLEELAVYKSIVETVRPLLIEALDAVGREGGEIRKAATAGRGGHRTVDR